MTSRVRFSVGLVLVAIGATSFAIAFRASLSWFYRAVYDADSVVTAIASHAQCIDHLFMRYGSVADASLE